MHTRHVVAFIPRPVACMQFAVTVSHRTPVFVVTCVIATKNPSTRHLVLYTGIIKDIRIGNKACHIQFVLFRDSSQEFRRQFLLDFRIQGSHIQDGIVKCQFHGIPINQHFLILIRVLQSAQPIG